MKILVCVKQVPALEDLSEEGEATDQPFRMNRLDEFAVEAALSIREEVKEGRVEGITVGPDRSAEVLKRTMGMGADNGVHIRIPDGETDAWTTAGMIAAYAGKNAFDLILAGAMSDDSMQGQVGPMTAEILGIPFAGSVVSRRLDSAAGIMTVEREIEGGSREVLEVRLPALLTVQSGSEMPRYPVLSHMLRANRTPLSVIDYPSLSLPRVETVRMDHPKKERAGWTPQGTPERKADALLSFFREKGVL